MKVKIETTTTSVTQHTVKLAREDIIALLRGEVPDNAVVTFTVPSGGDWSGEEVEVSTEHPVIVHWQEVVTHE